jgi:long-chain fatty acid transport protein
MQNIRIILPTILLGALSPLVWSGGFYFPEIATPGSVGTAGASNPTNVYDASNSLTNPAAMVYLEDDHSLRIGMQIFAPTIEFESSITTASGGDGGNAGDIAGMPGLFYAGKINEDLSVGFAVSAAMGGGIDYGDKFVGRYQATKAVLSGAGVTGSVGYRVNEKLALGAALTMVNTQFEQDIAVNRCLFPAPGPCEPGATRDDGLVSLEELDDWSPQYALSMTYELTDNVLLGLVYRSKSEIKLDGDFKVSSNLAGTPLEAFEGGVKLQFDAPEVFEVGLKYQWRPDTVLFLEADIERFSQFSNNYMTISNTGMVVVLDREWHDTYRLAAGLLRRNENGRVASVGVSYDSSSVDDEDRTFDLPVDEQIRLAASIGQINEQGLNYSLASEIIWLGDGRIDQTAQGVRTAGKFDTNMMLVISASIDYRF